VIKTYQFTGHSNYRLIQSEIKELIKNVFSLNDTTAEDVMVHRSQVAFLKRDDARTTLLNEIAESGYSRFPVYGENIDDIVGILYAKTYLTAQSRGERCEMKDFLMPPRFVHASTHINRILLDMQREHAHMAVVVDDYGGVIGIITLEVRPFSPLSSCRITRSFSSQ